MSTGWYYRLSGVETGPFTSAQLEYELGQVGSEDVEVRHGEDGDWQRMHSQLSVQQRLGSNSEFSAASTPPTRSGIVDVFIFAILLPLIAYLINSALLAWSMRGFGQTLFCFAFLALEMAFVSWVVSRYLQHSVLRWCVLASLLVAVNLQVHLLSRSDMLTHYSTIGYGSLSSAFYGGQLAALVACVVLLGGRRLVRCAVGLAILVVVVYFRNTTLNVSAAMILLYCQLLAAIAVCVTLRAFGYQIEFARECKVPLPFRYRPARPDLQEKWDGAEDLKVQFSVLDLLFWMTATCFILTLVKLFQSGVLYYFASQAARSVRSTSGQIQEIPLAVCLAGISLVAAASALGDGSRRLRFGLFMLVSTVVGILLFAGDGLNWWGGVLSANMGKVTRFGFWIMFSFFSASMSFSLLLKWRALDYRIVREDTWMLKLIHRRLAPLCLRVNDFVFRMLSADEKAKACSHIKQ